jgi:hypothetical protein
MSPFVCAYYEPINFDLWKIPGSFVSKLEKVAPHAGITGDGEHSNTYPEKP